MRYNSPYAALKFEFVRTPIVTDFIAYPFQRQVDVLHVEVCGMNRTQVYFTLVLTACFDKAFTPWASRKAYNT